MLVKELETLKASAELISVTLYDEECPVTGIVYLTNSRVTALVLFDDNGEYGGWTLFETSRISGVTWGNREHQAVASLIDTSYERVLPVNGKKTFNQSLVELGSRLECISLYIEGCGDDFDMGRVAEFDSHWLKVHTYGSKATLSRSWRCIARDTIVRIEVDTPYMNRVLGLHKDL